MEDINLLKKEDKRLKREADWSQSFRINMNNINKNLAKGRHLTQSKIKWDNKFNFQWKSNLNAHN